MWIIGVIIAIYLIGVVVFSFLTLPNTFINGNNVSFMTKAHALGKDRKNFESKFKGRDDREFTISTDDINYKENLPKNASIDQNPFTWPKAFFDKDDINIDYKITYDENKLNDLINNQDIVKNIKEPKNAHLEFKEDKFEIIKEEMGNKIDPEKLKNSVLTAFKERKEDVKLKDEYINPEIYENDEKLKDELNGANEIADMDIKYPFPDKTYELTKKDLVDLFDYDDGEFELNYDRVYEYFRKMAQETDTYGTTRKFNATGIGEIEVGPGIYGYMMDVEGTTNEFYNIIEQREGGEFSPSYLYEGYTREENGSDIGSTYVEIDLSRQTMWAYIDGELLVETPIVSGRIDWPTNVGVGKLLSKEAGQTLKGEDFDGSKYETPVDYWMPFGWDGEGIHDADWRSSFGGGIYQANGSHGCINTPPANAAVIFNNMPIGCPVIVYESSTSYSPAMSY
ncbi:MAG: L,D-transpeptidase family protein [Tissierellia bacterium]|nr:L,D-transpeptidase family protein [Tissierellia bacterium]